MDKDLQILAAERTRIGHKKVIAKFLFGFAGLSIFVGALHLTMHVWSSVLRRNFTGPDGSLDIPEWVMWILENTPEQVGIFILLVIPWVLALYFSGRAYSYFCSPIISKYDQELEQIEERIKEYWLCKKDS